MIAIQGNHLSTVGEGLLILLLYGLFFWRLLKSKPGNRLVESGFLTLIVFAALSPVRNTRDVPIMGFGVWIILVFLHCFATLYFLFQRMFRALVRRSDR
jgi:hypothetical protein